MKKSLIKKITTFVVTIMTSSILFANDGTGYVSTNGVQYIKNKNISMYSEDLFISKEKVKVKYQFKNLTNKDITENIVFPMPKFDNIIDSFADFADIDALYNSFTIKVNQKQIKPQRHVRTFMFPVKNGERVFNSSNMIDTTEIFKSCGITEQEILSTSSYDDDSLIHISNRLKRCQHPQLNTLITENKENLHDIIDWKIQVIYSWQQTFKANAITYIEHEYQPLVGGAVDIDNQTLTSHCATQDFKNTIHQYKSKKINIPYQALSYILTTGGTWATPIKDFKLTVQRDKNEIVSFCWNGQVKKISETSFLMTKKNFIPQKEFNVIFVNIKPSEK